MLTVLSLFKLTYHFLQVLLMSGRQHLCHLSQRCYLPPRDQSNGTFGKEIDMQPVLLAISTLSFLQSIFLLVMARAVCHLAGDIQGTITFLQEQPGGPCVIKGMLQGLTEGHHGIHILEFGDISQGCKSAGAHFNPHNKTHGGPEDNNSFQLIQCRRELIQCKERNKADILIGQNDWSMSRSMSRHVGDLGNIEANDQGQAEVNFTDSVVSLTGEYSVIGRTLEVCEGVDDLGIGGHELSLTTGNSGACLACGIIGISKYSEQTKVPPDDPV